MASALDGTVRDLARSGDGVVETERGVVFAAGVLPGERVRLHGVQPRGSATRAKRVEVVAASGQRQDPACPIVDRCGGCPLMIATDALEARFKRGLVEKALAEVPGASEVALGWTSLEPRLAYRRRARLAWRSDRGRLRLGYRAGRSRTVVDVRRCAVLSPPLEDARRWATRLPLAADGELHFALGAGGPVVALRSDEPQPPELYSSLAQDLGPCVGVALRAGGATADATWGDPREVTTAIDGQPLLGSVAGFSQPHAAINDALVRQVVGLAEAHGRDVLELFSGAGNLTVALAPGARSLLAVERDEAACAAARENLAARALTATVRCDDAETYRPMTRPDVVLLDPPRSGAPGASARLAQLGPPTIVMVSCDPPTLSRDLRALAKAGYRVDAVHAFDMFPQTAHVETVVRLRRA